ncbi:MAG TPA: YitT family protein, partial [Desulfurivibrio alkaliphilus]|nr:YitT family protein [Desulfurivibrio alkaliphilus]
ITLRSQGSAGGADILSVMLMMRFSIPLGSTLLALNVLVLTLTALIFSLDSALYTLIQLYVAAKLVNLVVTGLSQRKAVMIISKHWPEINREILRDLRRGTTVIPARGGYSGSEENMLYAVVNFRDIGPLKRTIRAIDPDAFVVVTDTMEVMNYRIGNQPHW